MTINSRIIVQNKNFVYRKLEGVFRKIRRDQRSHGNERPQYKTIKVTFQKNEIMKNNYLQNFNSKAIAWDSKVPFGLTNFLEDILQPPSFKMSLMSNSGL